MNGLVGAEGLVLVRVGIEGGTGRSDGRGRGCRRGGETVGGLLRVDSLAARSHQLGERWEKRGDGVGSRTGYGSREEGTDLPQRWYYSWTHWRAKKAMSNVCEDQANKANDGVEKKRV